MRRIEYILPVDYMRGSLAARQTLTYNGLGAYALPDGKTAADNYQPIIVANLGQCAQMKGLKYYKVRTKSSVRMDAGRRLRLAAMGGAMAIYAAIVADKSTNVYRLCSAACPAKMTLRKFLINCFLPGLMAKSEVLNVTENVQIQNPWGGETGIEVTLNDSVINKFADVLSIE